MFMVDQTSKVHMEHTGKFTGSACLERKKTLSWLDEHAS